MRRLLFHPDHRRLLVMGFVTFTALGAIQAMYGPAFPGLRARFGVDLETVSDVVTLHFAGSFVTIAASSVLLRRFGYRPVLRSGAVAFVLGALMVALGPAWPVVWCGALLGGLGFGALDIAGNLLFARAFAPNAAPALNLLNATFGLGAVLGPTLVGAFGATVRVPFLALAVLGVAVLVLMGRVEEPALPPDRAPDGVGLPWAGVGFVGLYFLYVTGEVGVGSWEATHLAPLLGASVAAYASSAYWGGLTVGRLLATSLSARVRPADLVLGASGLALIGLGLAHWAPVAPYAYVLVGLAFAPIFPTALAWLARVYPRRSERIAPLAVAAANLGPVASARPIGTLVERGGPELIPTLLLVPATALFLVVAALWRHTRRR